jgi:hypothetical protein
MCKVWKLARMCRLKGMHAQTFHANHIMWTPRCKSGKTHMESLTAKLKQVVACIINLHEMSVHTPHEWTHVNQRALCTRGFNSSESRVHFNNSRLWSGLSPSSLFSHPRDQCTIHQHLCDSSHIPHLSEMAVTALTSMDRLLLIYIPKISHYFTTISQK